MPALRRASGATSPRPSRLLHLLVRPLPVPPLPRLPRLPFSRTEPIRVSGHERSAGEGASPFSSIARGLLRSGSLVAVEAARGRRGGTSPSDGRARPSR
jgi:hypothetical protein